MTTTSSPSINFNNYIINELKEDNYYNNKEYDYDDYSITSGDVEYTTQEWLCSIKNKEYTSVFFIYSIEYKEYNNTVVFFIQTLVCYSLYKLGYFCVFVKGFVPVCLVSTTPWPGLLGVLC